MSETIVIKQGPQGVFMVYSKSILSLQKNNHAEKPTPLLPEEIKKIVKEVLVENSVAGLSLSELLTRLKVTKAQLFEC